MKKSLQDWFEEYSPLFDVHNETMLEEVSQRAFFKGFVAALEAVAIAQANGEAGKTDLVELSLTVYDTLYELGPYNHAAIMEAHERLMQKTS